MYVRNLRKCINFVGSVTRLGSVATEKMKLEIIMRKISFASLILPVMLFAFALPLYAADSSVSVSALGTVSVKPDMAEFQVRLISTAKTAEQSTALTAKKYRAVQQALRNTGVSADDAVTQSFTVRQEWEWNNSTRKRVFKGYTAAHVLKVTVRSLADAGRVIDASVQAGADEIPLIGFASSKYKEKRREALAEAVQNARKDAQVMAAAAGMSLGKLLDMQTGSAPVYPLQNMVRDMGEKTMAAAVPTEISPGEQSIEVPVSCRWLLVDKS